jgi:hypothetical protein
MPAMSKSDQLTGDSASLQRQREVATILAAAVVRLRLRAALPGPDPGAEKPPESAPNCLEVSNRTRLSVHGS